MTAPALTIYVNRVGIARSVTPDEVERAVRMVAEAEGVGRGEISVTFLDAVTMEDLNETHLESEGPTDVIAFNLGAADNPLGDVYVCPEVAANASAELGVELREELLRLVVHGALHLFGYDHPADAGREESEMFRVQENLLSQIL